MVTKESVATDGHSDLYHRDTPLASVPLAENSSDALPDKHVEFSFGQRRTREPAAMPHGDPDAHSS